MLSKGQTLAGRKGLAPGRENFRAGQTEPADHALVALARDGDLSAFETLYVRHQSSISALCRRWLRDEQLSEDATQETFLRAWAALPHYATTGDFGSWLRRIARNHCHDVWRSQHGRTITEVPTDVHTVYLDRPEAAEEHPDRVADQLAVRGMLGRLSNRDAALLVEHHAAGLSVRALARRWQLTQGAMQVALHRARQRARRSARDEGLLAALPVALGRRLAAWWSQLAQQSGLTAANFGEAFYVVIAAAVLAAAPSGAPSQSQAPMRDAVAHADTTVAGTHTHTSTSAPRSGTVEARSHSDDSRPATKRRTQATEDDTTAPHAVDGVAIPGVDRTVNSSGSGRQTGRVGVQTPDGRTGAYMHVGPGDPEPLVELYDTACENVAPDDPLVYCNGRPAR